MIALKLFFSTLREAFRRLTSRLPLFLEQRRRLAWEIVRGKHDRWLRRDVVRIEKALREFEAGRGRK